MAPRVPDEIDVFTAPHSRMKELVNIYTQKMQCVDFRDGREVVSLLKDLDTTLCEFKSHESIENIFIMDQLKNRLKQRQISNTAVCECHNDNQLSDVVQLVRQGTQVREGSVGERITFGQQLQQAFGDFVNTFLPHMEEEEQVFQPLLVEYFEYDELKVLKEIVLKEHELVKEQGNVEKAQDPEAEKPETDGSVKDLRDLDWDLCTLTEPLNEHESQDCGLDFHPPPLPLPPEEPIFPPDHLDITQELSSSANTYYPELTHHSIHTQASCQVQPEYTHDKDIPFMHYAFNYQSSHFLHEDYQNQQCISFDNKGYDHTPLSECTTPPLSPLSSHTPILPTEVLVEIFKHLTPPDLCRCAQVCSSWNNAVFTPALWPAIYPVQWAQGIWESRDVGLCGALEDEAQKHQRGGGSIGKWDEDADVDESERGEESQESVQECGVMEGLVWFVLPRVGAGVSTLVVDAGRGISSRLLQQALLLCPNLVSFSAAHTSIDSYAFKGLWLHGALKKLRHLDLQGCEMVDDLALQYLALCVGQGNSHSTMPLPAPPCLEEEWIFEGGYCHCGYSGPAWPNMPCQGKNRGKKDAQGIMEYNLRSSHVDIEEIHCPSRGSGGWEMIMGDAFCKNSNQPYSFKHPTPQLASLNLSGCWRIRDKGLLACGDAGALLGLTFLDVSGCYQLTGRGLESVARVCPSLPPQQLWYCDDIMDGPFPTMANGCANLANPVRICCRGGQ